jgi:hypothetical protein
MDHRAARAAAVLRARLGDAIPEMIEVVVSRLGEAAETDPGPRRLLNAIVSDPSDHAEVTRLSNELGWTVPRGVCVIVLDAGAEPGDLPPGTLADWTSADPLLVVPDPDGPSRSAVIGRALRGCHAAVGPSVPLSQAAHSLRWARQALALVRLGVLGDSSVVRCDDHLPELLLLADPPLARTIVLRRLAPLDQLRSDVRQRITETMLVWLELGMNTVAVARRMNVHPQTVRYRVQRIKELFGYELEDTQHRFELMLALRVAVLLSSTTGG